jgi:hypothetical protein
LQGQLQNTLFFHNGLWCSPRIDDGMHLYMKISHFTYLFCTYFLEFRNIDLNNSPKKLRCTRLSERERALYIYKQGGKPIHKKYRHVEANVNTWKENQNNQNINNEVEDLMLKGHFLPQNK